MGLVFRVWGQPCCVQVEVSRLWGADEEATGVRVDSWGHAAGNQLRLGCVLTAGLGWVAPERALRWYLRPGVYQFHNFSGVLRSLS